MPPRRKSKSPSKQATKKQKTDTPKKSPAKSDAANSKKSSSNAKPTVADIVSHELTQLGVKTWAKPGATKFSEKLVKQLYNDNLFIDDNQSSDESATISDETTSTALLELSRYLENYLWPALSDSASVEHVLSVLVMVNEKFKENLVSAFDFIGEEDEEKFNTLIQKVISINDSTEKQRKKPLSYTEQTVVVLFLINCFQSLENRIVRKYSLKLVSLPTWSAIGKTRRDKELQNVPKLAKHWKQLEKKHAKAKQLPGEATFLPSILQQYADTAVLLADRIANNTSNDMDDDDNDKDNNDKQVSNHTLLRYVAHAAELLRDLEAQLPTRRFAWLTIDATLTLPRVTVAVQRAGKAATESVFDLVRRQLAALVACHALPIDAFRGVELSQDEVDRQHCAQIQELQSAAYDIVQNNAKLDTSTTAALKRFALANIGSVDSRTALDQVFAALDDTTLRQLGAAVYVVEPNDNDTPRAVLLEALLLRHERRAPPEASVSTLPLYPNDELLWDTALLPDIQYAVQRQSLALPKLGLQFLSFRDYLLRSFELYRLASAYDVRLDINDAIRRLAPRLSTKLQEGTLNTKATRTELTGLARMALPIDSLSLGSLGRPRVGELQPSRVPATVSLSFKSLRGQWRTEWDALRRHDVVFLITLDMVGVDANTNDDDTDDASFPARYGVRAVRGASVVDVRDGNGRVYPEDPETGMRVIPGDERQLTIEFDAAQYQRDADGGHADRTYRQLNVIVRRKPKENNFKNVLEAVRDLLRDTASVPVWLHDALLGYGDPRASAAGIERDADDDEFGLSAADGDTLDFFDTFLDAQHVRDSFPDRKVTFHDARVDATAEQPKKKSKKASKDDTAPPPPYRLQFEPNNGAVNVTAYTPTGADVHRGTKRNTIRFAPSQIEAVRRGMCRGLTLVVGPPGTGKTDVAVQIVSNLYHNNPAERILLVTHSNQALNQLFDKLVLLDVDARHMLRLGHGASQLDNDADFSRFGRVSYMLSRRLTLLEKVTHLTSSIVGSPLAQGAEVETCQVAAYLFSEHILPQYNAWVQLNGRTPFPFESFIRESKGLKADAEIIPANIEEQDARLKAGSELFNEIKDMFDELADCRAFEIMRSGYHRGNYLTTQQARIVAMTTTHAAIKRAELLELGFGFDSLVMEEAAQVLEIETFVPLLSQRSSTRLQRVTLIGDHRQLPPVVKSAALRRFARFDQSLFGRLVRLGVPHVVLDQQGRARPQLSQLYSWRYPTLTDLPSLTAAAQGSVDTAQQLSDGSPAGTAFARANPGLAHVAQLIDVGEYDGHGETAPTPHFYQNLGEAEYVVALYMYMRVVGYPASRISILTTYNGQKRLIRDVVEARCANNPLFGRPAKISTVDKFQGQQNDYILLSLVRTKNVGHLRDIRRLVVAMSRARLGLYVFCRKELFANCYELTPTFSKLLENPDKLQLVKGESYADGTERKVGEVGKQAFFVDDVVALGKLVA